MPSVSQEGSSGQSRVPSPTPATTSTTEYTSLPDVNDLLVGVQKLKGRVNYHDWSFKMKMIMIMNHTWSVCNGTADRRQPEWHAKSIEVLTAIGLTIEGSQIRYIRDCVTGPEAWEALRNQYEKASRPNQFYWSADSANSDSTRDQS